MPNGSHKLLEERLSKRRKVLEGDRLNYTVKVMVTWFDQVIIEMFVQQKQKQKKFESTISFKWKVRKETYHFKREEDKKRYKHSDSKIKSVKRLKERVKMIIKKFCELFYLQIGLIGSLIHYFSSSNPQPDRQTKLVNASTLSFRP